MSSRISIPRTARPAKWICCQCSGFHHIPATAGKAKSHLENNGETTGFEPPTGCKHTGCGGCLQCNSDGYILLRHEAEAPYTWRCGSCDDTSSILDVLTDRVHCCELPVVDMVHDHLGQVVLGKAEETAKDREIHSAAGLTQFQHWLYGIGSWVYLEDVDEVMKTSQLQTNRDPGEKTAQKVKETGAKRQNDGSPSIRCDDLPYWDPKPAPCQDLASLPFQPSHQPSLPSDSRSESSSDGEVSDVAPTPPRTTETVSTMGGNRARPREKKFRGVEKRRRRYNFWEKIKAKSAEGSVTKHRPASSTAAWGLLDRDNALERAKWSLPPRKTTSRAREAASTKDPLEYSSQERALTRYDTTTQTVARKPSKRIKISDLDRPNHHTPERYEPTAAPTNKRRTTPPPSPYGQTAHPHYDRESQELEFRSTAGDDIPLHWQANPSYRSRNSYGLWAPPPPPPQPQQNSYVPSWEEMGARMGWAPMHWGTEQWKRGRVWH